MLITCNMYFQISLNEHIIAFWIIKQNTGIWANTSRESVQYSHNKTWYIFYEVYVMW